jgi:Rps23 Pro-64 3,4-dihydroxylase Tpa1-like proline 4-hydroxylase
MDSGVESPHRSDVPVLMGGLLADEYRQGYEEASPWPHAVIDGLINPAVIAAAESEELERALSLPLRHATRQIKAATPRPNGPNALAILQELRGQRFLAFLEDLTGIAGLIPDPAHYWAGLHVFPRGAFQALHRDFRVHPITHLFHRVNVLVYLNSDWKGEYGGDLELWASDASTCARRIAPVAGTSVIFESSWAAIHGIPDPIRCPDSRARLSLASNYYTVAPGPGPRESMFRRPKRPEDPWYMGFPSIERKIFGEFREFLHPGVTFER